jgi:hypothetical protein
VHWIETKLVEHGVAKVVPQDDTLTTAFHRALTHSLVAEQFQRALYEAEEAARRMPAPAGLREKISRRLETNPAIPWDAALAEEVELYRQQTRGTYEP